MEELPRQSGMQGHSLDQKRALALWTEVANKELLQTQRSEQFLSSQRELIRCSTDLRIAQQDLVEHFGKQYGFPTRTELDDVHRTLTEHAPRAPAHEARARGRPDRAASPVQ